MTKLIISADFATLAATLKSPWVINNGLDLKGPYAGRDAARTAKAADDLAGKIEKFDLAAYEIEAAQVAEVEIIAPVVAEIPVITPVDEEEAPQVADEESSVEADPAPAVKMTKVVTVANTSTIKSPTKAVWHIVDEMKAANPAVRRKDVVAECIARGIATFTARTQYQLWFTVQKEMAAREAEMAKAKSAAAN